MNKDQYLELIKSLECALCGAYGPCDAHHPREGQGLAQKNDDWNVIPLCKDCHQGNHNGIHGRRAMWNVMKKTEMDLLGETHKKVINMLERSK